MSKKLLKSIVQKLKEKKQLKEWDVVDLARIQKIKTPLISNITAYLKENLKLSHAQYYELIAMANGYPNFDSFKPFINAPNFINPISTGSILLDHFLNQFTNGFKIVNEINVVPYNYQHKNLKDLITITQDFKFKLKLKEFDLGNPSLLKISLHGSSPDQLVIQVDTIKNKLGLDRVEIPLRNNQSQIQNVIHQELEIYELACGFGIVHKRGGTHTYKDIKIMGREKFIEILSKNTKLLEELKHLCIQKLKNDLDSKLDKNTAEPGGQALQYFSGPQADEIRTIIKEELTKSGIMDKNGMIKLKR